MQKLSSVFCLLLSACFTVVAAAQVDRSQLVSGINDREPIDNLGTNVEALSGELKKVYFFTQISDMENQQVTHRWLYQGEEKAAVTLNIGSNNWRTYSSKNIPSNWAGQWQVQVWQSDLLLISHDFVVTFSR
jgi:hypothetical protein